MPRPKKKHYADETARRAACGIRMTPETPRVSNGDDFFAVDADGTLCQNCYRAATNEDSPY